VRFGLWWGNWASPGSRVPAEIETIGTGRNGMGGVLCVFGIATGCVCSTVHLPSDAESFLFTELATYGVISTN
jgi:hypothetical protein